jgi:hypothetical protein
LVGAFLALALPYGTAGRRVSHDEVDRAFSVVAEVEKRLLGRLKSAPGHVDGLRTSALGESYAFVGIEAADLDVDAITVVQR